MGMHTRLLASLATVACAPAALPNKFTAEIVSAANFKKIARPADSASDIILSWYYSMNDKKYDTKFAFERIAGGAYSIAPYQTPLSPTDRANGVEQSPQMPMTLSAKKNARLSMKIFSGFASPTATRNAVRKVQWTMQHDESSDSYVIALKGKGLYLENDKKQNFVISRAGLKKSGGVVDATMRWHLQMVKCDQYFCEPLN